MAPWRRPLPLRTRLALSATASVAIVIGLLTVVGLRLGERRLEDDLRDTARVTALAVADDLELRPDDTPGEAIVPTLHEFMTAAPSLQSITLFRIEADGPSVLASTSSAPAPPDSLIRRAAAGADPVWQEQTPHIATVAVPVTRDSGARGAVAVTVSLAPVEQFRRTGRLVALAGTLAAVVGITLLIHLMARRLILAPIDGIRRAMSRVEMGDLDARAPVLQRDELGELAAGLNQMLAELQDLHRSLNDRVESAKLELQQRNEQLIRSYESVLQLRDAAARAQRLAAVGQTMANVAHQIGTPLNLVSGHVQLLRQESSDPALQRRLHIIEGQVERVTSSVRDLLDRARPHGERRPVDVGTMLSRLADAMRPRLAASGIVLETEIAPDLPPVTCDETQLELALLNVVNNAVDAMPNGGTLAVSACRNGSGLRVDISDTGGGIAPDLLPRIFDPWLSTKPSGSGAGLGLSITRDVIASSGGTIVARSSPGAGATFTVELPPATPEPVQTT